jgi:ABC-type transport system substrate-binding protein/methyl-accepting chemotaxis protein
MKLLRTKEDEPVEEDTFLKEIKEDIKLIKNRLVNIPRQLDTISKATDELNVYAEKIEDISLSQSYLFEKIEKEIRNIFASVQVLNESSDMSITFSDAFKKTSTETVEIFENVITELSSIPDRINRTASDIKDLQTNFTEIKDSINEVLSISKRTEETSRNAGIKAFHAGEAGKGFEVVAQEMGKLAKISLEASELIPEFIDKIDTENIKLNSDIEKSSEHISFIIKSIDSGKTFMQNIKEETEKVVSNFIRVKQIVDKENIKKQTISNINIEEADISKHILISTSRIKNLTESAANIMRNVFMFKNIFTELMDSSISSDVDLERKTLDFENAFKSYNKTFQDYVDFQNRLIEISRTFKTNVKKLLDLNDLSNSNINFLSEDVNKLKNISTQLQNSQMKIGKNLDDIKNELGFITEHIENLHDLFKNTNDTLNNINILFKNINANIEKIKLVSTRTKILSLYAGIEAAKAGTYKYELNIIVSDLKSLSENSGELAIKVDKIISEMEKTLLITNSNANSTFKIVNKTNLLISTAVESGNNVSTVLEQLRMLILEVVTSVENQKVIIQNMKSVIIGEFSMQTNKIANYLDEVETLMSTNYEHINEFKNTNKIDFPKIRSSANIPLYTFRYYIGGKPICLLPYRSSDATTSQSLYPSLVGLTQYSQDINIVPAVAQCWEFSENGKNLKFFIRKNIVAHNGKEITSEDVEFSLYKIASSSNYFQIVHIKGVEEYHKKESSEIHGIKIIDKYCINLELLRPYMPIIQNLAVASSGIIPANEEIYIKDKENTDRIVSCGPFILSDNTDDYLRFKAFENYFMGKPLIDELIYYTDIGDKKTIDLFYEKELDYIALSQENLERVMKDKNLVPHIVKSYDLGIQYLGFNMESEGPFKSKQLRQAAAFIIDRKKYLKEIMKSTSIPAKGIFPPSMPVYNQSFKGYYYNEEMAISLAKKAGFGPGAKEKVSLLISGKAKKDIEERFDFFRKSFLKIGIDLELEICPWSEYISKVHKGETELFSLGWSADTGDPDNFLFPLFYSDYRGESGNSTFYSNKQVDELIINAMGKKDPVKRIQLYRDTEKKIMDDCPIIPLSHGLDYGVFQPYIKNIFIHPLNILRPNFFWYDR